MFVNESIPQIHLKVYDKRHYPMYDNDTSVEVIFAKSRVGYNTAFYAVSYSTPFFCLALNSREELYSKVDETLEFWYGMKENMA